MTAVRLLVVLACAAPVVAAPVPKDFDPQPTAAQLAAAREAIEKIGGQYHSYTDATSRVRHRFWVGMKCDNTDLAGLPVLPFRHDLDLSHSPVSDAGLKQLRRNPRIEKLELRHMKGVTGSGLEHLAGFRGLAELNLEGTRLADETLAHLRACKGLTTLVLHNTMITDAGVKELADLPRLTHLDLGYTKVTAAALKHLTTLPKLRWLSVQGSGGERDSGLTDAGVDALFALPELVSLDARYCWLTAVGLKKLAGLNRLTTLRLSGAGVTDTSVADVLAGMPHLTDLDLSYTTLTDDALKGLDRLQHLTVLNLGHSQATDVTLARLAKLNKLTRLELSYAKVTDTGVKSLKELHRLEHLALGNTQVTDTGLTVLVGLKELSYLNLAETAVTDAGLANVPKLPRLKRLHLNYDPRHTRTKEGIERLQKRMPDCVITAY